MPQNEGLMEDMRVEIVPSTLDAEKHTMVTFFDIMNIFPATRSDSFAAMEAYVIRQKGKPPDKRSSKGVKQTILKPRSSVKKLHTKSPREATDQVISDLSSYNGNRDQNTILGRDEIVIDRDDHGLDGQSADVLV